MLSYRHGFHAGFWADVHKHAALALLLAHLKRKDKPFTVIDPFAGDAVYDLASPEALKTGEFRDGISRLWRRSDAPDGVAWYLAQVRALNAKPRLATYPGSPELAPPSPPEAGLQGCGLAVVNPPWRFEQAMDEAGRWIAAALWAPRAGRHAMRPLAPARAEEA